MYLKIFTYLYASCIEFTHNLDYSYGPMNPVNILEGIQTNYGSRADQVKFVQEEDFRKFATRILNYGGQVKYKCSV